MNATIYDAKENLKVTVIQSNIVWENPDANLEKYSQWIKHIGGSDVIVLPEMFSTGFSMNPKALKEGMTGTSVAWMKQIAAEKNAAVAGSLIIEEKQKIYNRALWVFPDGSLETYDKSHLFTMGQEHLHYTAGKKKIIVEYKGWRFCPLICYDLRFPVWARNAENYDVLLFMANWPSPRHHVWKNLLVARAIENQSYCLACNRIGNDGMGLSYLGDSACISPKGEVVFMGEKEGIQTFTLSYSELHKFRKIFPLLDDKDDFSIL